MNVMSKKIAIIGGGNLGASIAEGLIASGFASNSSFGDYRGSLLEAGFDLWDEPDVSVFLLGDYPQGFGDDQNRRGWPNILDLFAGNRAAFCG